MPGRNLDRERPLLDQSAVSSARGARLLDPTAEPRTRRGTSRANELPEDAARHLLQPPGPSQSGKSRSRCRLRAVPPQCAQVTAPRTALARRRRGPPRRGRSRPSPRGPRRAHARRAAAEADLVAEEGGEEVGQVAEVDVARLEAAAAQARVAVAVVELARLRLRQHLVRLDDLAEPLLGVRRVGDVGVELAGEPPEGPLDLRFARRPRDAEQLVVVAVGRRHGTECSDAACGRLSLRRRSTRRSATARARRSARPERLLVVHPHRPDEADGAERAVDEAVTRADERDLREGRVLELVAEAHEGTLRRLGCAEDVDQCRRGARRARTGCGTRRAPRRGPRRGGRPRRRRRGAARRRRARERRAKRVEERALAGSGRVLEAARQEAGAELQARRRPRSDSRSPTAQVPGRPGRRSGRAASRRRRRT